VSAFLATIITRAQVSRGIVAEEDTEHLLARVKPVLLFSAKGRVNELFGHKKTHATHYDPEISRGTGEWYVMMKTDIYESR